MTWCNLSIGHSSNIFTLFPLVCTTKRQEIGALLWLLEPLRACNADHLPSFDFLNECSDTKELQIRIFQHVFQSADHLMTKIAEESTPDEMMIEDLQSLLELNFKKFKSFSSLWARLVIPTMSSQLPDLQAIVIFQALLFFLKLDLKAANWQEVLGARKKLKEEFHKARTSSTGFPLFYACFSAIWGSFISKQIQVAEALPRFLFSVLDFFLLRDLLNVGKASAYFDRHDVFKDHHGAAHLLNKTSSSDIRLLLQFFNEDSEPNQLWRSMLPFAPLHIIFELLQIPHLRGVVNNEIQLLLSHGTLAKKVQQFVAPQFSPDPKQYTSIVYSIFVSLTQTFKKDKLESLAELYLELSQLPQEGLVRLKLQALEVTYLQRAAEEIAAYDSLIPGLQQLKATKVHQVLVKLMGEGNQKQIFFLESLRPVDKMNEVLREGEACRILAINDLFKIREELKMARYYLFPFAVDENLPEGMEYKELEKVVTENSRDEAKQWITNMCHYDPTRGYLRARIYLATIAYFQFYNASKKAKLILDLIGSKEIKSILKITDDDTSIFKIFCEGGVKAEKDDDLSWFFTNERRDHQYDLTLRHLMANILIFVLGCPPATNHFYTRIFTPQYLSDHVRGPGSTFPNEQDCGYYLTENGEPEIRTSRYAGIFGGSKLYLLTFNMLTWAALCLALLLNQNKTKDVGRVCYHGHYRQYEETLRNMNHLPDHIVLKKYVLQRPNMFYFWLKQEPNLLQKNIEAPFFVSQVLYYIWKDILSTIDTPEASIYKGTYKNEAETLQYENRIKEKAFDVVMAEHLRLRVPYESFLHTNEGIKLVLEHRDKLSEFYKGSLRILPLQVFFQNSTTLDGRYPTIDRFKEFRRFRAIKHLPFLVDVYQWIHKNLGLKFELEEVLNITFKDAINSIQDPKIRAVGNRIFSRMSDAWNEIVENHPSYQVCRVAQEAGEATIPKFEDNFKLSYLIDPGYEAIEFDHLYRVTKDICDLQNNLVPDSTVDFEVRSLSTDLEAFSILIHIQEDEDALGWVKFFADHGKDETTFDWEGIESQVSSSSFPFSLLPSPFFSLLLSTFWLLLQSILHK